MEQLKKANQTYSSPSSSYSTYNQNDDLEAKFQQWEVEQELQKMKENL